MCASVTGVSASVSCDVVGVIPKMKMVAKEQIA